MDLLLPNNALIFWTILIFLFFIFSLVAIIHVVSTKNTDAVYKLMWVVIVLFIPFLGSLLYFILRKRDKQIQTLFY